MTLFIIIIIVAILAFLAGWIICKAILSDTYHLVSKEEKQQREEMLN